MRKSILFLMLILTISIGLFGGCGNKTATTDDNTATNKATDNGNNATDKLKEELNQSGTEVKEGASDIGNAVKYGAIDLKNDLVKAGYTLKDSADSVKNYFKGKETDYYLDNDLVRVYEYDNAADLDADIATISSNGLDINGNVVYTTKPYYYRKGDSLIVYEGSNPTYVSQFDTLYGSPLIP